MREGYHLGVSLKRRRALSALNPIRRFVEMEAATASDERVVTAMAVARRERSGLPADDADWFGWGLPDEPRHRYAAVGCEGHGFVVDVVSGHILWEGPIESSRQLPRSIADTARGN
jgi:hypothetical protein